jgi:hypothetical protein
METGTESRIEATVRQVEGGYRVSWHEDDLIGGAEVVGMFRSLDAAMKFLKEQGFEVVFEGM